MIRPKRLRNLRIREVSSVDAGAGEGVTVALMKRDGSFSIPLVIAKTDADQQLIFGWASVSAHDGQLIVDKQNDVIHPEDLERAAYDFVLHARAHGDMHDRVGTGRLIEATMFTKEKRALGLVAKNAEGQTIDGLWVGFKVDDPTLWATIKRGERPEFSIGGSGTREELPVAKAISFAELIGKSDGGAGGSVLGSGTPLALSPAVERTLAWGALTFKQAITKDDPAAAAVHVATALGGKPKPRRRRGEYGDRSRIPTAKPAAADDKSEPNGRPINTMSSTRKDDISMNIILDAARRVAKGERVPALTRKHAYDEIAKLGEDFRKANPQLELTKEAAWVKMAMHSVEGRTLWDAHRRLRRPDSDCAGSAPTRKADPAPKTSYAALVALAEEARLVDPSSAFAWAELLDGVSNGAPEFRDCPRGGRA
jgi:hypothetical protein